MVTLSGLALFTKDYLHIRDAADRDVLSAGKEAAPYLQKARDAELGLKFPGREFFPMMC